MKTGQLTPFQLKLHAALRQIPAGRVMTYAALAARLRCRSPRAVGQALRANPYAPRIPCHRIICSDLTLGGYQGADSRAALARKRALLAQEGVRFLPDGRVDPTCVIRS